MTRMYLRTVPESEGLVTYLHVRKDNVWSKLSAEPVTSEVSEEVAFGVAYRLAADLRNSLRILNEPDGFLDFVQRSLENPGQEVAII